jgi:hypothetical protein
MPSTTPGFPDSIATAKAQARRLKKAQKINRVGKTHLVPRH